MTRHIGFLGMALGLVMSASSMAADLELNGQVRFYQSGGEAALQVDVRNNSDKERAYGPSVYVRIVDMQGNLITEQRGLKLYPYKANALSRPNSVYAGNYGYIPLKVNTGSYQFHNGQPLAVKIAGEGQSNFGTDNRNSTACQKGVAGCD